MCIAPDTSKHELFITCIIAFNNLKLNTKNKLARPKQKASKMILATELLKRKSRECINPPGREMMQNGSPGPNF